MKKLHLALMALALTLSISCKDKEEEKMDDSMEMDESEEMMDSEMMDSEMEMMTIDVPMGSKSGSNVTGSVVFTQMDGEVEMKVALNGLTPGTHAIHLHENGDCSSADGKSAGGHWNPNAKEHGDWDGGMNHMGDIGNLEANEDGTANLTFSTDKWCMDCDDDSRNILGKGVIVHAVADDFESQPSGAAGARVACGVIE